jgi:hypothetical protein
MIDSLNEPPIIEVRNPVTYIKRWWSKVMGKEGIDFSFRIHPVTAVISSAVIATIGFGAGRFVLPDTIKVPFFEFGSISSPTPISTSVGLWKETAFTGKLQFSVTNNRYFLLTTSSEAIVLDIPTSLDLVKMIGKRIFAVGNYNKQDRLLKVTDVKDLEILFKESLLQPFTTWIKMIY